MTKRFLLVAVAVLSLVGGAAVAQGAAKKKHSLTATLKARVLTSSSSGGIYTGQLTGGPYGEGVVIIRVSAAAAPNTFNTVSTAYYKSGTLTAKGSNTATPRADGSGTDYAGSVKVTKGTGIFKGATGTIKLTGSSQAADPTYGVYKLTGTLKY